MKFLCRHEPMASYFIYRGLAGALTDMGNQFGLWNTEQHSAFDIFDMMKPDVFIGQGYNLDKATIKCINENPEMKVVLKVGAGSKEFRAEYDDTAYQVLMATAQEHDLVGQIKNPSRITVFNYCHPKRVKYVIGEWEDYKVWGFLPAADTKNFYPVKPDPRYTSDVAFVGGYWGYKSINLDQYIIPLCLPLGKYNVKIFGTQPWPVPQYIGAASDDTVRQILCSATICPNIHEPHSNTYGFDVVARLFNVIACRGFCITDYVASINEDIFTDNEIIMVKSPKEFFEKVDYYLAHPDERIPIIDKTYTTVMKSHTYYTRAMELINVIN